MIVFDLDDTLYYERDFVESGQNFLRHIHALNPSFDINGKWDNDTLLLFRNHIPSIRLSEGTKLALDRLKSLGIRMGIITDGRSATQRNKFYALGLSEFIDPDNLIISEDVGGDKLSGRPFTEMMKRNGEEKEWMYVADNPAKDFLAPNRFGWTTVMLSDANHRNVHPQNLPDDINYHPKLIINSLEDILQAL